MEFTVNPNAPDVKKAIAEGKKYRVIYERSACIGAAACVAVFDKRWEMAPDNKANLKGSTEREEEIWQLDIDDSEYEDLKTSGEVCPVNVIHVFRLASGEKII